MPEHRNIKSIKLSQSDTDNLQAIKTYYYNSTEKAAMFIGVSRMTLHRIIKTGTCRGNTYDKLLTAFKSHKTKHK